MRYILILLCFFLLSCTSSVSIKKSRINLIDNRHTIQVFGDGLIGQLVGNNSFIINEIAYYDKDFNLISSSREGILYPNYVEIFNNGGSLIGNLRIVKTFHQSKPMYIMIINDLRLSKLYKTNEFVDFSKPIVLYTDNIKVASIHGYNNERWSMVFYEESNVDLLIHMFRFTDGNGFSYKLE